jgi:hypothetical protein
MYDHTLKTDLDRPFHRDRTAIAFFRASCSGNRRWCIVIESTVRTFDSQSPFRGSSCGVVSERDSVLPGVSGGMTLLRSGRLTNWGAAAAMLLAVGLFTAPGSARAGCSHPVTSRSDRLANLHQLDELIMSGTSSSLRHDGDQSRQAPPGSPLRTPCSGPSCSNGRVPLPISTMSPGPDGRDRWGNLGIAVVVDDTSVSNRTFDEPSPAPACDRSSIFHPPRV